ncbi:hypothetical protein IE53DRAFT_382973 [Violaceomyces palustris]|uniref:Uncharacterized protein n=1 Tax=Violaceomyces palustris TaxID=1673888 RepID=A0ACD0P8H3_9BASI|nr:hypothetical protein IE53DRAFT_382973 [Violaceomyces palustris]
MSEPGASGSGSNNSSSNDGGNSTASTSEIKPKQNRAELHAQAVRFLTSAKLQASATDDAKKEFLRSKGLDEDEIAKAFEDSKSPALTSPSLAGISRSPNLQNDDFAFERAARDFDNPIEAPQPPTKTYPKSPLALYYEPNQESQSVGVRSQRQAPDSPLTRYQVLLGFFKTLSLFMMLGGGATAVVVALYRTYVLPRITATFDARSIALKHHLSLFERLVDSTRKLTTYVPASSAGLPEATVHRKGVLKKVHFDDEVESNAVSATQSQVGKEGTKNEMHTTTTETEAAASANSNEKDGLLPQDGKSEAVEGEAEAGVAQVKEKATMEPIDLTEPLRKSLGRLAAALRSDMSSSAVGPTEGGTPANPSTTSSSPSLAARVSDAGSDSGSEEWEDDDDVSDDGLEFDPYGSYQKKKHSPSGGSARSKAGKRDELKQALKGFSAEISTHQFIASSQSATGGLTRYGGYAPSNPGSGSESPKSGDIGQVKAEIRSLKGLLLSRRNFPSFGRASVAPALPTSEVRTTAV